MSLFKTKEFWSTKCGQGENYSFSCMCIANFFSTPNNSDQIITGSLNGYLRFFSYNQKLVNNVPTSEGDNNPFSFEKSNSSLDISIEHYMKHPIIQLAAGRFCSDSRFSVAILNPNRLVLVEIDEDQMAFRTVEEFNLKRIAYNFCFGQFGRVSNRDFICVQSTDTTLSFYMNGHLSFSCYLSDYLLSGPIAYLAFDDSILIVNSNRYFQSYKYKNLAVTNSKNTPEATGLASQKRTVPDWNYNLGEEALEIRTVDLTEEQDSSILILCRYSIFILGTKSRNAIKKRFECRCKLVATYGTRAVPRYIMTTGSNDLLVMENTTLRWQAALLHPDVIDIGVGKFAGLPGFFVTLTSSGNLSISFLGTDPSTNTVLTPLGRDIMTDSNEDELQNLQRKIEALSTGVAPVLAVRSTESRRCPVKIVIDYSCGSMRSGVPPEYQIDIKIKNGPTAVTNVVARISCQAPIVATQKLFHFSSLGGDREVTLRLGFISRSAMVTCDLRALVYVTCCQGQDGLTKMTQISIRLPLGLVLAPCAPCKQARFKLTMDTNQDVLNLVKLFPEFQPISSGDESQTASVAIGFQYHGDGPVVTVLASAAARRYRIQSDHFEAIWLVLQELSNRWELHVGAGSSKLMFSEALPLDSYFLVLDYHFSIRTNLVQLLELLETRSKQFRAIQKLVLTKTREKSPQVTLQNLDTLLENAITQLLQLSELVSEQQQNLTIAGNALASATNTIGFLLQIVTPMPQTQQRLLQDAFSGAFRDFPDFGLEELYDQIFVFLLKISMGTQAGQQVHLSVTRLELPRSIDKLKKHIQMLCECLAKGTQLSIPSGIDNGDRLSSSNAHQMQKFVTSPRTELHKPKKSKKSKKTKKSTLEPILD